MKFEGTDVKAHLDHIWAMGETMYPLLAARWAKKKAPEVVSGNASVITPG
jgi:hypothetical protein